jgi:hypothetical protein
MDGQGERFMIGNNETPIGNFSFPYSVFTNGPLVNPGGGPVSIGNGTIGGEPIQNQTGVIPKLPPQPNPGFVTFSNLTLFVNGTFTVFRGNSGDQVFFPDSFDILLETGATAVNSIPEPSTFGLLGAGAALGLWLNRRRR